MRDEGWDRAKCKAVEIGFGGGIAVMIILEVLFQW